VAGPYGNLGRSISTGIGSFFGNNQARQAGELAGLQQVALGDQIEQRRQAALFEQQKAQREADAAALGKPDAALSRIAALFQVPADSLPAIKEYQRTGNLPMTPAEPLAPGLQGPEAPPQMPAGLTPEKLTKIAQAFFADQSVQAGSSKSLKDAIEALVMQPKVSLTQGVAEGSIAPGAGGARFAALEGKPLFNSDGNGAVLDVFGGGLNEDSRLAQGAIGVRAAQAAAQKANAAQSYASADASRASAAKSRQDVQQGARAGNVQIVTDAGGNITLVDKGTGLARPAVGLDGKPVGARVAGGGNASESERKAATLLSRLEFSEQQLQNALQDDPRAAKPGYVSEAVRKVPFIGGDTPANMLTPQARQRVESAQLDILDAALTLGTGAAYTREQLEGYRRSYFPQIGDDPNSVADKHARLQNVIEAAKIAAGRAAPASPNKPVAPGTPSAVARTTPRPSSPTAKTDPVPVTSDADYLNLPSGTRFRAPDGTIRVKP
jgi:hypothetical protein